MVHSRECLKQWLASEKAPKRVVLTEYKKEGNETR
jgi:hypothetical protein